jgi:integrase/recombinase XerD
MSDSEFNQQISGNLCIRDALKQFILAKKTQGLTPKSIKYYQAEITRFQDFAAARRILSIHEINPDLIRQFLVQIGETRNKGGVHATFRPLRAFFLWYEEEVEPDNWHNPIRKVKIPSPRPKALPGISMEDYGKLIRTLEDKETGLRDRAMFYVLLDTCARATEFLNFNVGDVNLISGVITIRVGKGGEPRFVNIGNKSKKELRKYLNTRGEVSKKDPLFVTKSGSRFTYDGLASLLRLRCMQAGIERPGLHDIRRAGALELLRNGSDISQISRYLGHHSIEVTMRYLAINPDDLRIMHQRSSPVDNSLRY